MSSPPVTATEREIAGTVSDEELPFQDGDVIFNTNDEIDDDHHGRERTTRAGSLWTVEDIERYEPNRNGERFIRFGVGAPSTGAFINPYLVEPSGSHIQSSFTKLDLPDEVKNLLLKQLQVLAEIKDLVADHYDGLEPCDTDPLDRDKGPLPNDLIARIKHELVKAKVYPDQD